MTRHVNDYHYIDFCDINGNLGRLIEELQEIETAIKDRGGVVVEISPDNDGDLSIDFTRPESESETKARVAREKVAEEQQKLLRMERERSEFERLEEDANRLGFVLIEKE